MRAPALSPPFSRKKHTTPLVSRSCERRPPPRENGRGGGWCVSAVDVSVRREQEACHACPLLPLFRVAGHHPHTYDYTDTNTRTCAHMNRPQHQAKGSDNTNGHHTIIHGPGNNYHHGEGGGAWRRHDGNDSRAHGHTKTGQRGPPPSCRRCHIIVVNPFPTGPSTGAPSPPAASCQPPCGRPC